VSHLDYQSNYRSFTYDLKHFGDLPKFINQLHENDMYYIPVLDAGIAQRDRADYAAYDSGLK
jgi:lysosomal alpha-glucosidase